MNEAQSLTKDVHLWQHGNTYVFLLSGKAGVGKTHSALLLRAILEKSFNFVEIERFAKGVKDAAFDRFGWDGDKNDPGRKLLQDIGATGRRYNPNLWADQLVGRVLDGMPPDVVIVDDWRFPNEYHVMSGVDMFDVVTIRINAPDREILRGTEYYNDVSETSLDDFEFDYVVENDHNNTLLVGKLREIVEKTLTKS